MQHLTETERECLAMVARHMRAKERARDPGLGRSSDVRPARPAALGLIAAAAVVGAVIIAGLLAAVAQTIRL